MGTMHRTAAFLAAVGAAAAALAEAPDRSLQFDPPDGACLLQGRSSPRGTPKSEAMLDRESAIAGGDARRVATVAEVLTWCEERAKRLRERTVPPCKGIFLGGHAGTGGVTDFLSCRVDRSQRRLSFLEREWEAPYRKITGLPPGERMPSDLGRTGAFEAAMKCLAHVSDRPGTAGGDGADEGAQITIASCAGAYEDGPPCAQYIASKFHLVVRTTRDTCYCGGGAYARCDKGWAVWKPGDPMPPLAPGRTRIHASDLEEADRGGLSAGRPAPPADH